MANLELMPHEILLKILSSVPTLDLIVSVQSVSERLHQFISDVMIPSLTKSKVNISGAIVDADQRKKIFSFLRRLKKSDLKFLEIKNIPVNPSQIRGVHS
jgi:hypothetical protein